MGHVGLSVACCLSGFCPSSIYCTSIPPSSLLGRQPAPRALVVGRAAIHFYVLIQQGPDVVENFLHRYVSLTIVPDACAVS